MPPIRRMLVASLTAALGVAPVRADHVQAFSKALDGLVQAKGAARAEKQFLGEARAPGRNQLLSLYELATFCHWAGDCARSAALFAKADQVAHAYEGQALVSVTGGLGQAGATLTNDALLPWAGGAFDKVMSRTLNALNYLVQGDLEGARVEMRKAEEYQLRERERIQGKVGRAAARDEPLTMASPALAEPYRSMTSFVKDLRNSYENAFTYYLSSQIYRAHGQEGLNDALVDIKRALALAPDAPAVREAYQDLLAQGAGPKPPDPALARGTVVVLYEAGLVPRMSELRLDLPVRKTREDGTETGFLLSAAFPLYREFGHPEPPLRIRTAEGERSTSRVTDLRPLAVKALQERMPGILARSLAGAAAKVEGQKKAEEVGGLWARLAMEMATRLVTRADLRAWLSLPAELQASQFQLPPGTCELTLSTGAWTEKVALDLHPGGTTFIMVRALPGFRALKTAPFKGET